jgi:hypothetical protein
VRVLEPQLESELKPGDQILSIDRDHVEVRKDRLAKIMSASTQQALDLKIHQKLLAGT